MNEQINETLPVNPDTVAIPFDGPYTVGAPVEVPAQSEQEVPQQAA